MLFLFFILLVTFAQNNRAMDYCEYTHNENNVGPTLEKNEIVIDPNGDITIEEASFLLSVMQEPQSELRDKIIREYYLLAHEYSEIMQTLKTLQENNEIVSSESALQEPPQSPEFSQGKIIYICKFCATKCITIDTFFNHITEHISQFEHINNKILPDHLLPHNLFCSDLTNEEIKCKQCNSKIISDPAYHTATHSLAYTAAIKVSFKCKDCQKEVENIQFHINTEHKPEEKTNYYDCKYDRCRSLLNPRVGVLVPKNDYNRHIHSHLIEYVPITKDPKKLKATAEQSNEMVLNILKRKAIGQTWWPLNNDLTTNFQQKLPKKNWVNKKVKFDPDRVPKKQYWHMQHSPELVELLEKISN